MEISRRAWLSQVLLAPTIAAEAQKPAESGADQPVAISTGPYLQNPSEQGITIAWVTNRNTTAAVEYGLPNGDLKTVFSARDGLIDANERTHRITLTGLTAGAVYRYRAISRDIVNFGSNRVQFGATVDSGFREFRTLDRRKQAFSFLVFNDIHDVPTTIPGLLKVAGDDAYDFVVFNGDTVGDIDTENRITAMLDAATSNFASRIPLIWVRGNHETRGKFARHFPGYLSSPNGRYFYSFDHGAVHFTVLDAGEDKIDNHPEYSGLVDFASYRREQAEWLKAEVQSQEFRRARFRVVFVHMPFPSPRVPRASTGAVDVFTGMADAFENFGRTLDAAGIDMMISGHVHSPAIIEPEPGRHKYPIIRGGGPRDQARTLIRVNVTADAIEATILRPDGSVFGRRSGRTRHR